MNQSKYAFQAGLFILIALVVGMLIIYRIGQNGAGPAGTRTYVAVFDPGQDISGLKVGAEVRMLGVPVGRVTDIEVTTHEDSMDAHAHVTFTLRSDLQLKTENARIESQTAFTGGGWLNILSLGEGEKLDEMAEVSARSVNLTAMVDEVREELTLTLSDVRESVEIATQKLTDTAASIEDTSREATDAINHIEAQIDPVVAEYNEFIDEATGVMADARDIIGDSDSGEDIRQTLANLNAVSATANERLAGTLDQIDAAVGQINSLSDDISAFIDRTEQSLEGVDTLLADTDLLITDTRAALGDNRAEIDRMVNNARLAVVELRGMVEDLRANPSRLVWPPDEGDRNNLDLYASARQYANAAEDLQLAIQQLRDASVTSPDDTEKLERLRENLEAQFDHFDAVQREVWERFER